MTDPITTPAEALEAKRLAGRLWIMEALIERGQCPTPEGACSAAAAFLEALAARIAAPVALKPGQYVCERCGQVAWGGDHVCPGAPSARIAAPVAVVKPLEWREEDDGLEHLAGDYLIKHDGWGYAVHHAVHGEISCPPAIKAAKAAAQADYEARILSALTIQPPAQAQAEALAKVTAQRDELQRDVDDAGKKILHLTQREREAVAGAYLAAQEIAVEHRSVAVMEDEHDNAWRSCAASIGNQLIALTPANSTAALARHDAEVRKAALREVLALMKEQGIITESDVLALIDKEPTHG